MNEMSRPYLETYDAMESKLSDDGKGNEVFIVPAFWRCIHSLVAAKRSFSILFRTFGTDTDDVISAFNAFCTEYGYDHLLIDDEHIGCIHRNVWGGHTLILGLKGRNPMDRTKKIKQKTKEQLMAVDRMEWYYKQQIQVESTSMVHDLLGVPSEWYLLQINHRLFGVLFAADIGTFNLLQSAATSVFITIRSVIRCIT